ncbi:MAG: hemolysin family protein [Planctomycetota bacterium]|nr:hemolysin family protein [Planctomycetota bacterium]MDA1221984.1 hemolysin family protein [Planctomycetota bacterium]
MLTSLALAGAQAVPSSPEVLADGAPVSGTWLGLTALAVLLAATGAVAGAALLVYSPTKLARDDAGRRLGAYLGDTEHEYQVVARLLMLAGTVAAGFCGWAGAGSDSWARPPILATAGIALLLLCGILPAQLAAARAEVVLRVVIPVLRPLRLPLRFIIAVPLLKLTSLLLRLLRIDEDKRTQEPDEIADDILAAVSDSAQEVELPDEERRWIENIVELKGLQASEVMTPRTDMVSFPSSMPLLEAVRRAIEAGFSRYPVYDQRIDDVIGVFYAKDALEVLGTDQDLESTPVGKMVRKPIFVPESMNLVDLLRLFRATKKQMAVVLDEYGGTAGLVSIEDVLEEIVGEIEDEYDPTGEQPIKVVEVGSVIEVSGRTRIDEANEHLGDRLPEGDEYDTVAGWVFTSLDRIPKVDETLTLGEVTIRILEADDRRIARMRLTAEHPDPEPGAEPSADE